MMKKALDTQKKHEHTIPNLHIVKMPENAL